MIKQIYNRVFLERAVRKGGTPNASSSPQWMMQSLPWFMNHLARGVVCIRDLAHFADRETAQWYREMRIERQLSGRGSIDVFEVWEWWRWWALTVSASSSHLSYSLWNEVLILAHSWYSKLSRNRWKTRAYLTQRLQHNGEVIIWAQSTKWHQWATVCLAESNSCNLCKVDIHFGYSRYAGITKSSGCELLTGPKLECRVQSESGTPIESPHAYLNIPIAKFSIQRWLWFLHLM